MTISEAIPHQRKINDSWRRSTSRSYRRAWPIYARATWTNSKWRKN